MSNSDVDAILDAYQLGGASELISRRLVPVSEIKLNSWDLNIGRYLRVATQAEVDVPAALAELATAQTELREAEARLAQQLKAAGYE
jgi:type I restriction enzyme M protein